MAMTIQLGVARGWGTTESSFLTHSASPSCVYQNEFYHGDNIICGHSINLEEVKKKEREKKRKQRNHKKKGKNTT